MKANFYIENQRFCFAFDRYVIEEINGKRYVLPEKGAKSHASTFSDWIDRYLIILEKRYITKKKLKI